jgi:hypothetical protein
VLRLTRGVGMGYSALRHWRRWFWAEAPSPRKRKPQSCTSRRPATRGRAGRLSSWTSVAESHVQHLPKAGVERINYIHGGGTRADQRSGRAAPVTIPSNTAVANAGGTG